MILYNLKNGDPILIDRKDLEIDFATKDFVTAAVLVENIWDRSGTTIVPQTANDNLDIGSGNLTTTGTGTFGNLDVDTLNLNGNLITDSTGTIDFGDENLTTTGAILGGGAGHDQFSDFVTEEHTNHLGVSITAGSGLSGGGDLSTTRTLDLDINSLSVATIASGDFVPFWDITATATNKKITFANFEGTLNHDSLSGFSANEHIDWTDTSLNLVTSGSGTFASVNITDESVAYQIDGNTVFTNEGTSNLKIGYLAGIGVGANVPSNSLLIGSEAGRYAEGTSNLFMGTQAGLGVSGSHTGTSNTAVGTSALRVMTSATRNVGIGTETLNAVTEGDDNVAIGALALKRIVGTSSDRNVAIGSSAMASSIGNANNNVALGYVSLLNNDQSQNTAIGSRSGLNNNGSRNVFIGYTAGTDETGSDTLMIANRDAGTEQQNRDAALIYGLFNATTANQVLTFNASVGIGTTSPDTRLDIDGALTIRELSADPADPDEGAFAMWMSDGTASGDDGDILIKVTAGATTKTTTLVDFSAI